MDKLEDSIAEANDKMCNLQSGGLTRLLDINVAAVESIGYV